MIHIAVIGDIHRHFSAEDVHYFNDSDYDLLLVVGDLADWWPREALEVAGLLRQLEKPTLLIPGNHDTINAFQLLAEVRRNRLFSRIFSVGQSRRARALRQRLGDVIWAGYSVHPFEIRGQRFDVVAGRPLSLGGPDLTFRHYLSHNYGVDDLSGSVNRLKQCIDRASSSQLIFLAHNGPTGLGSSRADIWGCDFKPEEGDYGDEDLRQALVYARSTGHHIVAVVAGHMHHRLMGGGQRKWLLEKDRTLYLNAARVPRLVVENGRKLRHHVALAFDDRAAKAMERLV